MKDRFYIGWSEGKGKWEVFGWDLIEEPTNEATGYNGFEGPYETLEEAEEIVNFI